MAFHLTFSTPWDVPFERVVVRFRYDAGYPATGQTWGSGGEPGEAASVEVLGVTLTIDGQDEPASDCLATAFGKLFEDDLLAMGDAEADEARESRRSATRRWAA